MWTVPDKVQAGIYNSQIKNNLKRIGKRIMCTDINASARSINRILSNSDICIGQLKDV